MAKRFTDSCKWQDPWYRKLDPRYREFWNYLLDTCDAAGIWTVDFDMAKFCLGFEVKEDEALAYFGNRVRLLADGALWFIPKFITFQYGTLSEGCKPHQHVISKLKKHTLWKGYGKGIQTLKDKEQDTDKEEDSIVPLVIHYLNERSGKNFSPKSALNKQLIHARVAEGRSLEDFKKVIDIKCNQWKGDEKMEQYLRPGTLFNVNKFENYINEKGSKSDVPKSLRKYIGKRD